MVCKSLYIFRLVVIMTEFISPLYYQMNMTQQDSSLLVLQQCLKRHFYPSSADRNVPVSETRWINVWLIIFNKLNRLITFYDIENLFVCFYLANNWFFNKIRGKERLKYIMISVSVYPLKIMTILVNILRMRYCGFFNTYICLILLSSPGL